MVTAQKYDRPSAPRRVPSYLPTDIKTAFIAFVQEAHNAFATPGGVCPAGRARSSMVMSKSSHGFGERLSSKREQCGAIVRLAHADRNASLAARSRWSRRRPGINLHLTARFKITTMNLIAARLRNTHV